MGTFSIESNGRLENTAIYLNGEQIGGIKEILLSIDENGTFDTVIQYEGTDKNLYTKQIFSDTLNFLKIVQPSFTEEEAKELQLLTVESNGELDSTKVFFNEELLDGIVSMYVHLKSVSRQNQGKLNIRSIFKSGTSSIEADEFKAEISFRNEDDSVVTEEIF